MGIFDRMADIAKANMNDLLDHMEDPEKMLKNMIIEMEEALTKATSSLAKAMANEEHLRKQRQNAQEQAEQWEAKAALALQASQNDLVKEALTKKYGKFHFDAETGRGTTDDGNDDLVFFERNDKQFMRTTIVTFDQEKEEPVVSYREFEHSLIKPRLRNYAVAKKE